MTAYSKLAALAVLAAAVPVTAAETPSPSTYWMSAETTSGQFAGMGGGGRPSAASMMRGMMGGGSQVNHNLTLQLGSPQRPTAAPAADHIPPATLRAGPTLPLLTPKLDPAKPVREDEPQQLPYEKPKGRMLIYWGCGEHVGPGQPLVVDFAKPQTLAALGTNSVAFMRPPSPSRFATYGDWPNEKTRKTVPADGSLIGDHVVRGNYSPEIRFSLNANQDFLAPFILNEQTALPSGATRLSWNAIPGARAYFGMLIGASQTPGEDSQTVVLWSSSATRQGFGAFHDYLAQDEITRQLGLKALLPAQTTTCTVPAEVIKASPMGMLSMTAWGGEANFAYPPKPADPKIVWKPEWFAKVRYKSTTGTMLGMPSMGAGMNQAYSEPSPSNPQNPPAQPGKVDKKAIAKGLLKGITGF